MKHYLPLLLLLSCMATYHVAQAQSQPRPEVLLETTEGNIRIALYNETPRHRDNFLRLVDEHFYDSLLFHRVISNFMIQAGDPDSRHAEPGAELGEGDLGYTIEPEFRLPDIFHRRGVVAAAREGDDVNPERRSSACQFYIVCRKTLSTATIKQVQLRLDTLTNNQVKLTPEQISTYVTNTFPGKSIIKIERHRSVYEVKLNNGMEIEFNRNFQVIDMDYDD